VTAWAAIHLRKIDIHCIIGLEWRLGGSRISAVYRNGCLHWPQRIGWPIQASFWLQWGCCGTSNCSVSFRSISTCLRQVGRNSPLCGLEMTNAAYSKSDCKGVPALGPCSPDNAYEPARTSHARFIGVHEKHDNTARLYLPAGTVTSCFI